jgi:drug/metabolite transporter (DMT)-like permease
MFAENLVEVKVKNNKTIGIFFMLIASTCQILMSIFSKQVYKNNPYLTGFDLVFANSCVLLPFYSYVAVKRKVNVFWLATSSNLLILSLRVLLGVIGTLLLFWSFKFSSISQAILVYNTNPLIVILLGAFLLCEGIRISEFLLMLGAFAGVILISSVKQIDGGDLKSYGVQIAFLAAFIDGIGFICMRKINEKAKIHWLISPFYLSCGFFLVMPLNFLSDLVNFNKYSILDVFLLLLLSIF